MEEKEWERKGWEERGWVGECRREEWRGRLVLEESLCRMS